MYRHPNPYSVINHSLWNGECAGIAQASVPGLIPLPVAGSHPDYPRVCDWVRGLRVKGFHLPVGTVIATFDTNGCYVGQAYFPFQNSGLAHTALYLSQSKDGIEVIHQYKHLGVRQLAKNALILFGGGIRGDACYADGYQKAGVSGVGGLVEDDATNYYVVELRPKPPNPDDFTVHASGPTAPNL